MKFPTDLAEYIRNPALMQALLNRVRALQRLEIIWKVDGVVTRSPVKVAGQGAAIPVVLTTAAPEPELDLHPETVVWWDRILAAGGSVSEASILLADALIRAVNAAAFNSKVKYLLPLLGDDIIAARVPLRDFIDAGIAGNVGFTNADFSESTGLQGDGSTKRLELEDNTIADLGSNGGLGWWELDAPVGLNVMLGGYRSTTSAGFILYTSSGFIRFRWGTSANGVNTTLPMENAHYYGQRSAATLREIFKDGTSLASNTTSDAATGTGEQMVRLMGGQRDTETFYWGGRCAVAYMTDGTLDAGEVADLHALLNTYLITPTGRTPSTGWDAETDTWLAAISSAGGTVSEASTIVANRLIRAIKGATWGSKIKYLLPLLGDNLAAALQPLRDTLGAGAPANANFANADFSESTGLQGNGTNKRLTLTGFSAASLGTGGNGGLGWWENNPPAASTTVLMGNYRTSTTAGFILYSSSGASAFRWGTAGNSANAGPGYTANPSAHYYGQRSSATSRFLYLNGSAVDSDANSDAATGTGERTLTFFGAQNASDNFFWGGRAACIYLTDGTLTSDQVAELYEILQAHLITPMGR